MNNDIIRQLGYLTLGTRLKRLGERMQVQAQRILDQHDLGIPAAQCPFLAALDQLGPSTIGDLANAVDVSQPATTRTLGQLAKAGFVTIRMAHDDQRRKSVELTEDGRHLVALGKRDAWPAVEGAVRHLCENLSGPLLDQLDVIEAGLVALPLDQREQAE